MIQNEILINYEQQKQGNENATKYTVGRSVRRDIEIKLKAVSAEHCSISYSSPLGWVITEKDNSRPSSNGTFVFMKSLQQIEDHQPSDMIPLHHGMTISFINYELHVSIVEKTLAEMS